MPDAGAQCLASVGLAFEDGYQAVFIEHTNT